MLIKLVYLGTNSPLTIKKKIVITDDDSSMQEIFKMIFEREGFETIVLSTPIDLMQNQYQDADIYLLDKQMCGIDGLDVCRHLKQNELTRNKPVIIISASTNLKAMSLQAGADDYVEKPFSKKQLLNCVEEAMRNYKLN